MPRIDDSRRQGRSRGPHVGAAARDGDGRGRAEPRGVRAEHRARCASASSPACASRRSTTARSASSGARPPAPRRRSPRTTSRTSREWRTYAGYSERERLAVEYAERFALDHPPSTTTSSTRLHARVHRRRDPRPHRVHRRAGSRSAARMNVLGIDDLPHPAVDSRHRLAPLASRMGDLAIDTAGHGSDGRYTARLSRDWEIWGPNGGYIASIALRAAGAHSRFDRPGHARRPLPRRRRLRRRVDIEVTTLREAKRAESIRVSMTQHGQPIFDAMVWACRRRGRPRARRARDARRTRARVGAADRASACAAAGRSSRCTGSGPTSTSAPSPGSTTGRTARPRPVVRAAGTGTCPARRSTTLGRRVPFADPHRHDRLARGRASCTSTAATSRRASTSRVAFHRARSDGAVALRAGDVAERERGLVGCESRGLGARRRAPRGRRQPTPLPPRPPDRTPHHVDVPRGVEDRITPGLYLEMTDLAARRRTPRERVPAVLGAAGRRAGDVVAQRAPRPRRPAPRAARVRPPRRLRGRPTRSPRPTPPDGHHRPPLPPLPPARARACSPAARRSGSRSC